MTKTRRVRNAVAKREIKALFSDYHCKILYPDEVAAALRLPLKQVTAALEALVREEKIARAA